MKIKTTTLPALCILSIAAISCTKEKPATTPAVFESFSLNAVSEVAGKTHLDGLNVIWDSGDALSAFSVDADTHTNNKLECTSYGSSTASFSGEIECGTTLFYAVYPYGDFSYDNAVISGASIPTTQTATNGSFANGVSLAMAAGTRTPGNPDCGSLSFKNLCSILSFTLPENITFANRIVVTSKSGTGMAGAVNINCASQTISGASASSITLDGSFEGGGTYYIAVAPGEYANGFRFTISTTGGNSYVRETTNTVPAAAGSIYPLGVLSLALGQDAFTTSVSISHDVASNTLNGSTAKFNLSFDKSEFAGIVKTVSTTVTLKDANSNVCRSKTVSGTSVNNVVMDMTNGFYYLPNGEYTYTAEVSYTVNNGTKDVQRTLTYSGSATSPKPDSFTIGATLSGYTSYSDYKGTDGQSANVDNANSRDGSTIYAIGATYASGLSANVYNQCSGLLSISSTLDGNAASGNVGGQSWASHTIGATWSFDGASGTCASSRAVYVTGLPYNVNPPKDSGSHPWTLEGGKGKVTFETNRIKFFRGTSVSDPKVQSPSFVIPENIPVKIFYKASVIARKVWPITYDGKLYVKLSGVEFYNKTTSNTSEQITETTATGTLTTSEPYLQAGNGTRTDLEGGGYLYYVKLEYRQ